MNSPSASSALIEHFDGLVCDLDGVVYRGHQAVPYAVESLLSAMASGVLVVYATNNASRSPADVAAHLDTLGLPGPLSRVVTSAQAGARYVAERHPRGSRVLAVGGPGVWLALREAGLQPVSAQAVSERAAQLDHPPVAVLQGYGDDVGWVDLAEAAYAIAAGALWVATNVDSTLPTDRGLAPGNGTLVDAVRQAVSVDPVVVGKPHTPLYELSVSALGTDLDRTLAIGDRLDTDIMGANGAGMDSLFVFGGVHHWADVVGAAPTARPRYLATDLRCLHSAYSEPVSDLSDRSDRRDRRDREDGSDPVRWVCGQGWACVSGSGHLVLSPTGTLNERMRAAVAALWQASDSRGGPLDPRAGDGATLSDELDRAVG